jgi:hypothetical protein
MPRFLYSVYCLCVNVYCTTATGISGHFSTPLLRFSRAFSSVVSQIPGYNSQRRGTARTSQIFLFIVMYVAFSVFCVLFVCKCVLYYCHRVSTKCVLYYCHRVSTQLRLKINKYIIKMRCSRLSSNTRGFKSQLTVSLRLLLKVTMNSGLHLSRPSSKQCPNAAKTVFL